MKRTFDVAPWNIVTTKWAPEDKRLQESMRTWVRQSLPGLVAY
jgi:maltose phosphorylase